MLFIGVGRAAQVISWEAAQFGVILSRAFRHTESFGLH